MHEAVNMEVSIKKHTENIDKTYEEMVVVYLTVVMNDVSKYMKRLMVEQCRHIDQLIGNRVASLYLNDIKKHVSRLEILQLKNEGITRDRAPTDIMDSARKYFIRMGCSTHLPGD